MRAGVVRHTDQHGPDVDEHEQREVRGLMQREQEREDVIRNALRVAIERVESVARERGRHDPLVVRLVQATVQNRMMQRAVDPVDKEVGERQEERELERKVPPSVVFDVPVQLPVVLHLEQKQRRREDRHQRQTHRRLRNLLPHLILEEFRVLERVLVKDKDVGEGGEGEVDE